MSTLPTADPFDQLAPTYDDDFTHTETARHLRARVHAHLAAAFPPGTAALELGCGTGEDAAWLAVRGVQVTATDSSAAMREQAAAKTAGLGVQVAALDLAALPPGGFFGPYDAVPYDGAWSSFGVVNCVSAWDGLAAWLAARVRPGGRLVFGVIAPYPLWEAAWHTLHGRPGIGFRRWGGQAAFALPGAAPLVITYPTPGRFARAFAPWFRVMHIEPLGLFLPPTDVYRALERRPRLRRVLTALDERFGRARALTAFADHYTAIFARTHAPAP